MRIILLTAFSLLIFVGCYTSKTIKNIKEDAFPENIQKCHQSKDRPVFFSQIIDKRPLNETKKFNHVKIKLLIPLILYWNQISKGPLYANPKYYDQDLLQSLRYLLYSVIDSSRIATITNDSIQAKYTVKTELMHYYGVGYIEKNLSWLLASYSQFKTSFYPTGHIALKITLIENPTKKVLSSKYLSESYLHNPDISGVPIEKVEHFWTLSDTDARTSIATKTLKRLLYKFPFEIDEMISNYEENEINKFDSIQHFTILRLTKEYDFLQEVKIDYSTGKILSDTTVFRYLPIISKPQEWIVSPISSDGHYMNNHQYLKFIEVLKRKYNVSIDRNLNAANFYGIKKE